MSSLLDTFQGLPVHPLVVHFAVVLLPLATISTMHKDSTSCWSAIDGNVYDLTSWITQHPGGAGVIKGMCGKDGTAAYNSQHRGQGRPASELARFKIGSLK
ncbi:MAG: cytochrome b5 domain-containing protein [Actinobacteria bacterium]|nr:cytochrome b5 domain-containing protein [Actinomycetota bacterium]